MKAPPRTSPAGSARSAGRRGGCHHCRPRRRLGRGSLGVQRGSGRAGDRAVPGPGDLGGRARDRTSRSPTSSPTCARRPRQPRRRWSSPRRRTSATASTGSAAAAGGGAARPPAAAGGGAGAHRTPRLRRVARASGDARTSCRGAHPPAAASRCSRGWRDRSASSDRCGSGSKRTTCAAGWRRAAAGCAAPRSGCSRRRCAARERAGTRFRVLAGRLENLSPLAVLARGYAVCWNADRTAIVRDAGHWQPGDRCGSRCSRENCAARSSIRQTR